MAGLWYRVGTISVTNGSKKVTGFGTQFKTGTYKPDKGHTFWGPDGKHYEVDYVESDTVLYLVQAYTGATAAGQYYEIDITRTSTIPALSREISAQLAYAQGQYDGWQQILTGSGNVTLTAPDGQSVTVPALANMLSKSGNLAGLAAPGTALSNLGVSTFIKTLLDDADAATARATLGAQASNATLTALAGVTTAADKLIYATAPDVFTTTSITPFARTLIDDVDAAAMRTTLGIDGLSVNDLRDELEPRISDNESKVFEALRRSYADAGFNLVEGSFEEGGVLTSSTDVLLHKESKSIYAWSGAFPKVVPAGSSPTPVSAGNWVDRSSESLREDLKSSIGDSNIGSGVATVKSRLHQRKSDISLRTLNSDYGSVGTNWGKIVITGDSLSYNYQDFDSTVRASAESCYPGMNSWPFLVRDAIIRSDKFFVHGAEIPYQISEGISLRGADALKFVLPFNGNVQTFRASSQTETLDLFYRHFGPENRCYLWLLRNPNNTACSFNVLVDGVSAISNWDNKDKTGKYQGLELYALEIPNVTPGVEHKITITNFIGTASTPHATARDLVICGVSCSYNAVSLTGVGSQSSKYLVDNISSMVTSKSPDVAIIVIGANDPWAGNPQGLQTVSQYGSNLDTIISGIWASKASTRILLISPPYTSEAVISNSVMQQYIDKAEEVALSRGISFLNMAEFFAPIPTSVYRFDSIHLTKAGNELLCRELLNRLGLANMLKFSSPYFSNYNQMAISQPEVKGGRYLLNWNGSAFVVSSLGGATGLVTSATKQSDSKIRVYLKYSQKIHSNVSVAPFQDAATTFPINCTQNDIYNSFIEISLRKETGGVPVLADWTTYSSQFKFIVSVS